jgi:hypothetical protein
MHFLQHYTALQRSKSWQGRAKVVVAAQRVATPQRTARDGLLRPCTERVKPHDRCMSGMVPARVDAESGRVEKAAAAMVWPTAEDEVVLHIVPFQGAQTWRAL